MSEQQTNHIGWVNIDRDYGDILIKIVENVDGVDLIKHFYCHRRTFKRLLDGEVVGCPIYKEE